MADTGWISIHRKIRECVIWDSDEPFTRRDAWIDLLLLANHRDKETIFDGEKITIRRGQYLTSVRKLAQECHWGKDKTLKYLKLLEECEMITRDADSRRTLITIVNYCLYQDKSDDVADSNKDSEQTVNRHSSATNNNINNDNNKKEKINKKEKPDILFERLSQEYLFSDRIIESLREWFEYKTERKDTFVVSGMKKALTQIQSKINSFGEDYVIEVVNNSMAHSWQGLTWDSVKPSDIKSKPTYKTIPKEQWDSYMWNDAIKDGYVTNEDFREWRKEHVVV